MSIRESHERDTFWIYAGCPPKGNYAYKRKKLIDMKNLLDIKEEIKL